MNTLNIQNKQNGDLLQADEWNQLVSKTNELVQAVNNGGGTSNVNITDITESGGDPKVKVGIDTGVNNFGGNTSVISPFEFTKKVKNNNYKGTNVSIVSNNNINIEPRESVESTKGGNISLKPGDDIELCSHHRIAANQDEVSVKVIDGEDNPVKLQLNASEITLTTKDKQGDDANVFDINVNSAKNTKGYLKVRAQAIDLRSESHGGIALQPKGYDGEGNMNKIKFEHGGGDGLEFGTFNTEKTSIFTDEYRFNREGVWKMATRQTVASDKADITDNTTGYKYVKQADDFYDVISQDDEQCTTKDIIKTAYAMNGGKDRHTKITNKGAIEIATCKTYNVIVADEDPADTSNIPNISTISAKIAALNRNFGEADVFNEGDFDTLPEDMKFYTDGARYFQFSENAAPSIKIDSGAVLKLGGILDFGSTFNFGETDGGIEVQNKYTKKGSLKDCGKLKVIAVNNNSSAYTFNTLWDPTANSNAGGSVAETTISVPAGESAQIAEASIYDIIKLVNYMKDNNQGPWQV